MKSTVAAQQPPGVAVEVFTGEVSVRLADLAATAITEYRLAYASALTALDHAIACGRSLLDARQLVAHGDWQCWCAVNVPEIGITTARTWCRLAMYKDDLAAAEISSIKVAKFYLRALGAAPLPYRGRPMVIDVEAAKRLRQQGMSYRAIAAVFGVSQPTVARHLDPALRRRAQARNKRAKAAYSAGRKLLTAKELDAAVHRAGGSSATAYAQLRRCALVLDRAITETTDPPERTILTIALGFVHKAEDEVVRALRIDRARPKMDSRQRSGTPRRSLPKAP